MRATAGRRNIAYAVAVNRKNLPPPEAIGEEACRRTLSLLGAQEDKN